MTTSPPTDQTSARVVESLATLFGETSPDTIFSAPERIGDDLVIAAAAWERAGASAWAGAAAAIPAVIRASAVAGAAEGRRRGDQSPLCAWGQKAST